MMQYLAWRVLVGLNKAITISFLVVGHTKFAPDWCFGLLKQKFRKSKVDCLADLVQVVQASAEVNHAQLVGNENGDVIVPTYDWADHFDAPFRQTALKGIKSFHHFSFNASQPGEVAVQTVCDGPKKQLKLLSDPAWRPQRTDLPPIIKPNGLTLERQCYLYEKIREFCRPDVRDIVPKARRYGTSSTSTSGSTSRTWPPSTGKETTPLRQLPRAWAQQKIVSLIKIATNYYTGHTSGYVINNMTLKRLCL
jgi:hypothetical protein